MIKWLLELIFGKPKEPKPFDPLEKITVIESGIEPIEDEPINIESMKNCLKLKRHMFSDVQTIGELSFVDITGETVKKWHSLELAWKDNQRRISCIPKGIYKARKHTSPKFGKCFWIQDVPNRNEILIHAGNFYTQILGCILIGTELKYINKDKYLDVANSRSAIKDLMNTLKDFDSILIEIT